MVSSVVTAGRVSNGGNQYCYLTVARKLSLVVEAHKTVSGNDAFRVWREEK